MNERSAWRRLGRTRFWRWVAPLGNFVGVVCGLVGLITDLFSTTTRVIVVIIGVILYGGALLGATLVARAQREDQEEIGQLKTKLAAAGATDRVLPDQVLRMIAPVVFRPGTSWRLTVFILEGESGEWFLRPKIRCASMEIYEATTQRRIQLDSSVLRDLKSVDLPASGELADAPDRNSTPNEWQIWQRNFIVDTDVVQSLRMPTRKYAWCAARQPGRDGRTIALVAETVQPSGINRDVLASNLLAPVLEMVLRLVDLPESIESTA